MYNSSLKPILIIYILSKEPISVIVFQMVKTTKDVKEKEKL